LEHKITLSFLVRSNFLNIHSSVINTGLSSGAVEPSPEVSEVLAIAIVTIGFVLCYRMSYRTPNVTAGEQNELKEPERINQRVEMADNVQSTYTALRYPDQNRETEEGGGTQV
jgi:hypothetical protein